MSIWLAGSDSEPLFGTAMRSIWKCLFLVSGGGRENGSQMSVDVVESQPAAEHDHLQAVEQLADLQRQVVIGLVLGGDPHLARLFQHLLALRVHAGIKSSH